MSSAKSSSGYLQSQDDTDEDGNHKSNRDRDRYDFRRHDLGYLGHVGIHGWSSLANQPACAFDRDGAEESAQNPGQTADYRQRNSFDKKLPGNIAPFSTQCAANANFTGPLRDSRQHDVHDPDPTHD